MFIDTIVGISTNWRYHKLVVRVHGGAIVPKETAGLREDVRATRNIDAEILHP